jgi:site-specific recombinase XerD
MDGQMALFSEISETRSLGGDGRGFHYGFFGNFQSPHTREAYRRDLKHFFGFYGESFGMLKTPQEITGDHVLAFRNFLQVKGGPGGKPCAPKTVIRKLATLKTYFDFLIQRKVMESNPALSSLIKRPRDQVKTETQDLADEQVRALLRVIPEDKFLHRAVIAVLFGTGLRRQEILYLKVEDYQERQGIKFLRFLGKGSKICETSLHPAVIEALELYREWMKEQGRELRPGDWLFQPTRNPLDKKGEFLNRPLNPKTLRYLLQFYARKAGIKERVSPHSARATVIGSLLEGGADLYRVSQMVHHESVKTTQKYDKRKKRLADSPVFGLKFF